ncbi:MAG: penicillin-binding protein 2 [gamma proteobacterium symbiont of Lucinoma myriamae]|nr:penicillin-binding protein 2 [gamma proteobacterium symbiont of Lucinoma myriamae]MCU7818895.1 penicillin-binding protein 2 [gamma proteobacterium symbiont of Lucinoma myriamae]MCU7831066.1 penicillin-binding protein 2 [gamma proteobacterium symbiont of Lucinoma myriamae]
MSKAISQIQPYRIKFIYLILIMVCCALIWRVLDLQVINNEFLKGQGNARVLRQLEVTAHRGMITDRNGYPLAISTPVSSIWINPKEFEADNKKIYRFAKLLKLNSQYIKNKIKKRANKEFVYIKRRISPDLAQQILDMNIKGIHVQREYRRYYPDGEIFGHVLGFTDVDDNGQEGMELAYNEWLSGQSGSKKVVKDRLGQIIAIEEQVAAPQPGNDLSLSLDRGVQYLAYKVLKETVQKHKAKSGSIVVLDIETGEVIAMVNQPGFNPNRLQDRKSKLYRNRAITDLFEPGSTMKPIAIAAALNSGQYSPDTKVETGDGWFMIKGKTIKDTHAYGTIDVSTVLQKSSNVGTSKIALSLPKSLLWDTYYSFGFGSDTGSGFPGESSGRLVRPRRVSKIEQATLSFGYGMSVTNLQLTNAYSTIARLGKKMPISFLLQVESDKHLDVNMNDSGQQLQKVQLSPRSLVQVGKMMESVVKQGGTAPQASVSGYMVAGKTGTVKKASRQGGYTKKKYSAVFAGYAPASKPKLAIVVMIDEPDNGDYYGGLVAAPVFSKVMSGALRLFNVDPDNISQPDIVSQIEERIGRQG